MREHLIVVVPGIGGSVLTDADGQVLWSADVRGIAGLVNRPEQLSLTTHNELAPRGLIKSLKLAGFWTAIPGYEPLLHQLGRLDGAKVDDGAGPRAVGANVVAFGYDFRLGVTHAAQRLDAFVRTRLNELWPTSRARPADNQQNRVLIIAHSMGGLIARYWAGNPDNQPLCRAIMTLGTPHRGAPKALDVLVNGMSVAGGLHLAPSDTMTVLRQWQSLYDLLPRFPMIADVSTSADGRTDSDVQLLRPHQLPTAQLPGGWNPAMATHAHEMHRRIQQWWDAMPARGTTVVPRIGYGHGTLRRAIWNGKRLKINRQPFHGTSLDAWDTDRGDGTVPAISGLPIEMSNQVPVQLRHPLRHGPIGTLGSAVTWAQDFEGHPRNIAIEAGESPAANPYPVVMGVDVEPLAVAGKPIWVAARILGVAKPPTSALVFAVIRPIGHDAPRQTLRMERTSADNWEFQAKAPSLAPGLYSVTVTSDAIPGGGAPSTTETIEVIDGALG